MSIKPLQNWILVEQDEAETCSESGLIIPDSAQQKQEQGTVIAIGPGRWVEAEETKRKRGGKKKTAEKKFEKTVLKPGDRILYEKYSARTIDVDGQEALLVREEDVLGQWG
jgi:chaperonin GroES